MVSAFTTGAEGPGSTAQFERGIFQLTLSVHPAVNGHLNLFGAGEGKSGEEGEFIVHPLSRLVTEGRITPRAC